MMPSVPDERLAEGGWTLSEESSETRFELPTMRVVGHTRLYEDAELREAVERVTGIDRRWRFFFATRLEFDPPLAPGIGPAMLYGSVSTEAKREFATDLQRRGFENVSRGRGGRVRTDAGDRASLTKYDTRYRLDATDRDDATDGDPGETGVGAANRSQGDRRTLPVTGWLAVWTYDDEFRLAGGAYPDRPLVEVLDIADERLDRDPTAYREELIALIRAVR
jgi:hypothetical protein